PLPPAVGLTGIDRQRPPTDFRHRRTWHAPHDVPHLVPTPRQTIGAILNSEELFARCREAQRSIASRKLTAAAGSLALALPVSAGAGIVAAMAGRRTRVDLDSPWKEALELFLAPCLALLFPEVHDLLDWRRGYESLDKELQQIVRHARIGRRLADK